MDDLVTLTLELFVRRIERRDMLAPAEDDRPRRTTLGKEPW